MPKVSIVVPVYNAEQYLDDCLSSILLQDFTDFECVLVDDGSTDSSKSLCEIYEKADTRFVLLSQSNLGASKARFNGVKRARGEWIMFVDSDDTLNRDSLSLLLQDSNDCDIVIGNTKLFPEAYKWPYASENSNYNRLTYLKRLLTKKIHGGPCARIIKKELFNDMVFNISSSVVLGEDYIMNIRLCLNLKTVRMIDKTVYNYRYLDHDYKQNFILLFQRLVVEIQSPHS
jgi:glycosyltransferase involved in cell wall biosynthesis